MSKSSTKFIGAIAAVAVSAIAGAVAARAEPNLKPEGKPISTAAATVKVAERKDEATTVTEQRNATPSTVAANEPKPTVSTPPKPAKSLKKATASKKAPRPVSKLLARFAKKPETKTADATSTDTAAAAPADTRPRPRRIDMKTVNGLMSTGVGYGCAYVPRLCAQ